MRIGVFCQYNTPFQGVADLTMPVLREYCARHGYDLHESVNPKVERSIIWDRYRILAENIENYEWIVHWDCDAMPTNLHIRLEEFCFGGDIVISRAKTERGDFRMNDGVAFFRNGPGMVDVLMSLADAPSDEGIQCGQDALEDMHGIYSFPSIRIERHKAINSFLYQEYGMSTDTIGQWTPGDFVLHLPGRTNERRVEIFTEISKQIIR